jgi:hypothetical protein
MQTWMRKQIFMHPFVSSDPSIRGDETLKIDVTTVKMIDDVPSVTVAEYEWPKTDGPDGAGECRVTPLFCVCHEHAEVAAHVTLGATSAKLPF